MRRRMALGVHFLRGSLMINSRVLRDGAMDWWPRVRLQNLCCSSVLLHGWGMALWRGLAFKMTVSDVRL